MYTKESHASVTDVSELPKDLKRVLKVQFREFIHFVEDAQDRIYYHPSNNKTAHGKRAAA